MKKTIAIIINNDIGLYNFRKELLEQLLGKKYKIHLLLPNGERIKELQAMGCLFHELSIDRRGTNPFRDLKLLLAIRKLLMRIKPDVVLTYTIKPNIYGGIAAQMLRIPYIANITGLGSALEHPGILRFITIRLYRFALKKAKCVFCQNKENLKFIKKNRIAFERVRRLPGSGVNLQHFSFCQYPEEATDQEENKRLNFSIANPDIVQDQLYKCKFAFVSRVMKEKGIEEFLEAAAILKRKYLKAEFHICGFCEEEFENRLKQMQKDKMIIYHGMVSDIREVVKKMHCVVLPSYHEGMSNALLEAAAMGRPLIASDIPGCRECINNQKSGFLVPVKSAEKLTEAMEQFLIMPYSKKRQMGIESRAWAERFFDRKRVVDAYLEEIEKIKK